MKTKINLTCLLIVVAILCFAGCDNDGVSGSDGLDANVYYSEWFSPAAWTGVSGDWYFDASAPDLTDDVVEGGVILAYAWLDGDLYSGSSVRPLPAYAIGANWSFLVHEYGYIQFTCDSGTAPSTSHQFRFVAITGTTPALNSVSATLYSEQELRSMSYQEICTLFNIPE